jgi:hypothetical protein
VELPGRSSGFEAVGTSAAGVARSRDGIARACHFRSLSAAQKCMLVGLTCAVAVAVVGWACSLSDSRPARRSGSLAAALAVPCSAFDEAGRSGKASLSCTDPSREAIGSARRLSRQQAGLYIVVGVVPWATAAPKTHHSIVC